MRTIIFNNVFNETNYVLSGIKTQMRDHACSGDMEISFCTDEKDGLLTVFSEDFEVAKAHYKAGEVLDIGVLKRTIDVDSSDYVGDRQRIIAPPLVRYNTEMLHRSIQITRVRIERLKDISDEECFKEGVLRIGDNYGFEFFNSINGNFAFSTFVFNSPRDAFSSKICKEKGAYAWDSNPYMFVYDFKLIKDGTNEKR